MAPFDREDRAAKAKADAAAAEKKKKAAAKKAQGISHGSGTKPKKTVVARTTPSRGKATPKPAPTSQTKIPEREDRAAKTPKHAKQAQPIPLPSMSIGGTTTRVAPPKTWNYAVPLAKKPGQKAPEELPQQWDFMDPQSYVKSVLGKQSAAERASWHARNQQKMRADKARERAEIAARRKEVANIPPQARKLIGEDTLRKYVRTGERPDTGGGFLSTVGTVAKGVFEAVGDQAANFTGHLSAGARGNRAGSKETWSFRDDPFTNAWGDVFVGHDTLNMMQGKSFNPIWVAAELALVAVPLKGAPTALTGATRALIGTARLNAALRANLTVGEAVRTLTMPVSEVKALRNSRIREAAAKSVAEGGHVGDQVKMASSKLAGLLAGKGDGPIATFIRNDPRTSRTYTYGNATIDTPAHLSRSGKVLSAAFDAARRRGLDKIPGIKPEEIKYAEAARRKADLRAVHLQAQLSELSNMLPSKLSGITDWGQVYAARAYLKGVPIEDMIRQADRAYAEAAAAGDKLKMLAQQHHGALYREAAQYVRTVVDEETGAKGVQWTEDASDEVRALADEIDKQLGMREKILEKINLLDKAYADERVAAEQNYFITGKLLPHDDKVGKAIRANEDYKFLVKEARSQHSAVAEHVEAVVLAMARQRYAYLLAVKKAKRELLLANIAEHANMYPDAPGERQIRNAWEDQLKFLDREIEEFPGDIFFREGLEGGGIRSYRDATPEQIKYYTERYGKQDTDWRFDIAMRPHPYKFNATQIEKKIAQRERAGDLTWDNERMFAKGDPERDDIPLVGEISFEEMEARLLKWSTPEQRAEDAAWYNNIQRQLGELLKDEEILGWLDTQKGQGPAGGFMEIAKVIGYVERGEPIPEKGISTTIQTIRKIITDPDPQLEKGAKAKIADFFDSAQGREFRTIFGQDVRGGAPMVIDRWSSRALGVPESKEAVNILKNRFGIEAKSAALGEAQYERLHKRYEAFVKYLNDNKFDGRGDWTASEVQAMDWYAVQRQWGNDPDTLSDALDAASYRADFELTQGANPKMARDADLTPPEIRNIADAIEPELIALANSVPGVRVRSIFIDTSGWAQGTNASVHMSLYGERQAVEEALTKLARATDQGLVQASRWKTVSNKAYGLPSRRALKYENPALSNWQTKQEFFERLVKLHPEFKGHSPLPGGKPGFGARIDQPNLPEAKKAEWANTYMDSIRQIEADMGIGPGNLSADNLQLLIRSQHGAVTDIHLGTGDVGRRNMGSLSRPEQRLRRKLVAAIDEALAARTSDSIVREAVERGGRGIGYQPGRTFDIDEMKARGWQPIETVEDLEAAIGVKGDRVLRDQPGAEDAIEMVRRGEYPSDFVKSIDDRDVQLYTKYMISKALDREFRKALEITDASEIYMMANAGDYVPTWMKGKIVVGGMWDPNTNEIWLNPDAHWATYIHEIIHMMENKEMFPEGVRKEIFDFLGIDKQRGSSLSIRDAENVVDMFEAMILGFDEGVTKLKPAMKAHFKRLRDDYKATRGDLHRAQEMLDRLPENVRLKLEDVFDIEEEIRSGGRYVPEVRGTPFTIKDVADVHMWGRAFQLTGRLREGAQISTLTPSDIRLQKHFTGALLEGGLYDKDITKGTMEVVLKAIELQKQYELRGVLLRGAADIPTNPKDAVAIIENPTVFYRDHPEFAEKLKVTARLFDILDEGKTLKAQELDDLSLKMVEDAKQYFFPGIEPNNKPIRDMLNDLTNQITESSTPIPGVKWVSRDMLHEAGLTAKPRGSWAWGHGEGAKAAGKALATWDFMNDVAKAMTLAWNPAYYPMNMTGNAMMLAVQSGPFAPIHLFRSVIGMKALEDAGDILPLIDAFAGAGVSSLVKPGSKSGVLRAGLKASQQVGEVLIDRYPRRAAFLHEARRLGYRTTDQIRQLIHDPNKFEDLYRVSERTNSAMVDFRRLTNAERNFITRAIFVYPWLRGSTKWTKDFVLDHPMQAAAFAGLVYYQQDRIKESFPEGYPGFMKWYLPLKQMGEATPYGFRMDQALTPLQTLDLAAEIVFWIGDGAPGKQLPWGSNEESIVTKFNPLLEEVFKTINGWDSFTQQEVSKNLPDLFRRLVDPRERWASWSRLKKILDAEEHKGFYDTTQRQNWLRLFLGSLAPVNISQEAAAERSRATQTIAVPDLTDEQKVADFGRKFEEAFARPIPEKVKQLKQVALAYEAAETAYKREKDIDTGISDQERAIVLLRTMAALGQLDPAKVAAREDTFLDISDDQAEALVKKLRDELQLSAYSKIETAIGAARKEERIGG